MDQDNFQNALDIEEMEKSAGWKLFASRLEEELENINQALDNIPLGQVIESIGTEYLKLRYKRDAINEVLGIIEDIKARKNNG